MSKQKTVRRECLQSITLLRDGKRVCLTTGQRFEFTEAEEAELMKCSPPAISAKGVVDLDSGDVDLKKLESSQTASQTNPPSDAAASAAAKKTSAGDDEL